ncbi:plexin A3 isoform X2 [Hydra vulgaris]|uniref:plexin A3 isoform X2 n=1 Tax=Hydra vulgaris TaxID=6087 RepID=UPI001F5EC449|nr:plexin A3 isoform X2 [Hydra vulgaris]
MAEKVFLLLSWLLSFTFSNCIVDFIELEQVEQIQNILISNGVIYVGATNKILKLDSNFKTTGTIEIGPFSDDVSCIQYRDTDDYCTDELGKKYYDKRSNENQFLLLISTNDLEDMLMTCGNSLQGQCQFLNATSLAKLKLPLSPKLVKLASNEIGGTFVGQFMTLGSSKVLISARTLVKLQDEMKEIIRVVYIGNEYFLNIYKNKRRIPYSLSYDKNRVSKDIEHQYKFISIMQFGDFTYFFSVYQSNNAAPITKIIRMTISENDFGFYIEKPLQCSKNGKDYKVLKSISVVKLTIQAAKIFKSKEDEYVVFGLFKTVTSDFAVCYFHVTNIKNSIEVSLSSEKSPRAFWFMQSDDSIHVCLSSENVIKGTFLYESNGISHRTLFALPHERGITVFLSSQSSVYEYAVQESSLYKYAEVEFPINGQHVFTKVVAYEDNLYFSGNKFIARVSINNCTRRKTCLACLSGSLCGWCTLENRCTLRSECSNNLEPLRFINETSDTCPSVINIVPDVVEITSKVKINLTVLGVPIDVNYKCSFNGLITSLERYNTVFICSSIDMKIIPNLKIEDGIGTVNLSIVTEEPLDQNVKSVVDTTFTVFICASFKMCTKCITSANSCGWCVRDMKCVDKEENCPTKQEWLPHIGPGASDIKCPLVINIQNSLYSNGSNNDIHLTGRNLLKPEDGKNYHCDFKMTSEKNIRSSARWISETQIICESTELYYQEAVSLKTANLSVFMDESRIDVGMTTVDIFKCSFGDTDCTTCKNNPQIWNCVWCESQKTCVTTDKCGFLPNDQICPGPVISKVDPMKAPIKGFTRLSIFGTDLGSTFLDIVSVNVAGVDCLLRNDLYQVSKKVVCELNGPDYPTDGTVTVEVNSTTLHTVEWSSKFHFQEPLVFKNSPEVGPCSGETVISIEGKDLDIGNNAVVKVAGVACNKIKRSKTVINCTSAPGCLQIAKEANCESNTKRKKRDVASMASVMVEIDNFKLKVPDNVKFEYKTDPLVTQIYTYKESIILETFASGGQVLNVEGQRLNIVKQPQMTFYSESHNLTRKSDCQFVSKTVQSKMICLAPNISSAFDSSVTNITVMLGFLLDGVVNVKSFKYIKVFADPVFNTFPNILEIKTSTLILSGSRFRVLSKKDVNVSVGESECRVTDIGENLVCELPSEEELKEKNVGPTYPVVVYVGEKGAGLIFNVGSITFYIEPTKESSLTLYVTAASVAVALLLVIIVVLACLYRKKQKRQKEYQALYQVKMDRIESSYARECKEAFAGYMTGVSDLTNDVANLKLPPLHFHQYAMRVLYPGLVHHPILEGDKDESEEWKSAMHSFIKLMKEQDFTLTFIRTLESQSSFQMTDRCTVASLLMVAMQDDLRFATSILTMLLLDLIQKAGNGKHPKLLLRRTESVAEKLLTNWLAYTLHDFLEGHVGQKLFKLFSAINIHLEKQPIDAITSEAKNSLSEDKFLRQTIEFKTIVLNIEYICEGTSKKYEGISVLTCDTISQTKEKIIKHIYKDFPYREWPNVEELSLGFASANGAVLVLQDEDTTNDISGEWKRLNTLEHYKVPDHSNLRLAPAPVTPPYEYGSGTIEVVPSVPTFELTTPKSPSIRPLKSFKRKFNISSHSIADFERSAQLLSTSFQTSHASSPLLNVKENPQEHKLWHMVKCTEYPQEHIEDQRNSKSMNQNIATEVFLTRLLKTKETLQSFVNDLFNSIFGLENGVRTIPLAVKFLFDFLDTEANKLDIKDNEVHHIWKNNSLPLRFWINIIKNPNFCFDVKKSNTVDSCLSVIAQLFMDSCSPDEHKLGMESPSNKLLYAKEIPEYKKIVKKFYEDVRLANFNKTEFEQFLDQVSQKYGKKDSFNSLNAASELMMYAVKYKVKIVDNLEREGLERYAEDLQKIMESMPDD